jgi:hypothetical protein
MCDFLSYIRFLTRRCLLRKGVIVAVVTLTCMSLRALTLPLSQPGLRGSTAAFLPLSLLSPLSPPPCGSTVTQRGLRQFLSLRLTLPGGSTSNLALVALAGEAPRRPRSPNTALVAFEGRPVLVAVAHYGGDGGQNVQQALSGIPQTCIASRSTRSRMRALRPRTVTTSTPTAEEGLPRRGPRSRRPVRRARRAWKRCARSLRSSYPNSSVATRSRTEPGAGPGSVRTTLSARTYSTRWARLRPDSPLETW